MFAIYVFLSSTDSHIRTQQQLKFNKCWDEVSQLLVTRDLSGLGVYHLLAVNNYSVKLALL